MQIEINNVTKTYRGGKQAVAGVSMQVGPGVLGLLGPNGAGKSSLMRVLATITRPTSGLVTWNGTDIVARPEALRRVIAALDSPILSHRPSIVMTMSNAPIQFTRLLVVNYDRRVVVPVS